MKFFKKILFLIFLPALLKAQNNNLTDIDVIANQLVKNIRLATTEQIILQTNKKIYTPKENIWFKAFEVDSSTGRLTNTSKILFADLVDENDKVVHHLMLDISTAQQDGAFLSDSSLGGFYWIRAYTKNILDHNINNIAVKPVYILNTNSKMNYRFTANGSGTTAEKTYNLSLYPEGGCLISGASSLVAVKLTDQQGKPISDSVLIKDSRNETTAKFLTNANGLGKFLFEPSSYRSYAVFVLRNNHYDSITMLPAINPFAAQIAVTEQTNETIKARVLLEDSIYKKDYKTFLIGLCKDSICFAAVGHGNYEFNIPVSNFPPGVGSLLLYNEEGELVSERNIYIHKSGISITVQTDNTIYAAREKANMQIKITDAKGSPVLAALSIAVNDSRVTDSLNNFSLDTLANLPGDDADLIMLIQQNQNEYWQNIYTLKNNNPISNNNDNLYIKGTVLDNKKQALADKQIMLISNNQNGLIMQDTTNAAGKFSFELASFNTGTPFGVQVNGVNSAQQNYYVALDSVAHFDFKTPAFLKEKFSPEQLQNLKKTHSFYMNSVLDGQDWLPEVTVKGKSYSKETNVFPETIISKEILHSGRVNNVADAVLQNSKMHVIGGFLMTGGPNGFKPGPSDEPEIVMDGVVIASAGSSGSVLNFLKTISASGIDHIRILTGASAAGYGLIPGTGVIEIYSASNSTYSNLAGAGLKTIYPEGFNYTPTFEMPDYNDKHVKNSKNEDMRTSVYWNGDVFTDENGMANISFFTADIPALYIVTISGITATGDKIYKTVTFSNR